jgi:hypothetical protein
MKSLSQLLNNQDKALKDLLKHPYQKLLDECFKRINTDREEAGYKPITMGRLTREIKEFGGLDRKYEVLKSCQQSRNFTRCFYGKLKAKRGDILKK